MDTAPATHRLFIFRCFRWRLEVDQISAPSTTEGAPIGLTTEYGPSEPHCLVCSSISFTKILNGLFPVAPYWNHNVFLGVSGTSALVKIPAVVGRVYVSLVPSEKKRVNDTASVER